MAFNMQIGGPEHFWTLCIEIQFYLLIPVLLLSLSRKNIFRILLLLALISLLSKILFIQFHLNAYYSSLCRMDVVVLGCLAALHPYSANKKQYQAAIFGYSLLLAGLYLAFNQTTLNWSIRLSVISLGCLVTLFYVNNNQNIITRFLGLPIFEKIAKAGYSTYAFHPFCIYLYYKYLGQHHYIADLLFCILISVAVGFTGYRVIEFPLNNVRKRLLKNYTG
jgi:peptidoglycan/LPS O-acetylase OafA/YrhL